MLWPDSPPSGAYAPPAGSRRTPSTLVTLGAWAIVWILVAIFGGEKRRLIVVDEEGQTHVSRV